MKHNSHFIKAASLSGPSFNLIEEQKHSDDSHVTFKATKVSNDLTVKSSQEATPNMAYLNSQLADVKSVLENTSAAPQIDSFADMLAQF